MPKRWRGHYYLEYDAVFKSHSIPTQHNKPTVFKINFNDYFKLFFKHLIQFVEKSNGTQRVSLVSKVDTSNCIKFNTTLKSFTTGNTHITKHADRMTDGCA